jgi:MoaA/NifB/PqqE/SkfB family radical SAM enzyme
MVMPYLYFIFKVLRSNFKRLNNPYKLTLVLTSRCNLRCRYCRIWQRNPTDEMELDEIKLFFQKQPYFSWIDLGGGEITLRSDLMEIIEAILQRSPHLLLFHFPTNGYLPDRVLEAAKLINEFKLPRFIISVSLDGPRIVHDSLRGVEGSWERALQTFEKLRKTEKVETYLGMTLHRDNSHIIGETLTAVQEVIPWVKKTDFHFNIAQTSFYYNNQEVEMSQPNDLEEVMDEIRGWQGKRWSPRKFLEYRYCRLATKFLATGHCPMPCLSLSSSCFIAPDWTVYPCLMYDRSLDNLRDVDFDLSRI